MVEWTDEAKGDLRSIYNHIAQNSIEDAIRIKNEIIDVSETLSSMSWRGKINPQMNLPFVREIPALSYRMIYLISKDGVDILSLVHKKQNIKKKRLKDIIERLRKKRQ